jgi:hypothetical protein
MKKRQYIAIGIAQFQDSRDQVRVFYSTPENVRDHVINNYDQSLVWTFTESANAVKG